MASSAVRVLPVVFEPLSDGWARWVIPDTTKVTFKQPDGVQLKKDADGYYSTASDILVRSALRTAAAMIRLRGFAAEFDEPVDDERQAVTSVRFRLNNGADDYWWNGAQWAVVGAGNWNTAAEIHRNAATYSTTTGMLRLVVNLKTTDKRYTPSFRRGVLLAEFYLPDEVEDALLRTFVVEIRSNVRPEVDVVVEWGGGNQFNFGALELEESPGVSRTVVAAYNIDDDPYRRLNLLQGYAGGVVTLTAAQPAGEKVALVVAFAPYVAVATHPDYDEIAGLPALLVTNIEEVFAGELPSVEYVYDPDNATALVVSTPRVVNLRLTMKVHAARLLDYQRTVGALLSFIRSKPVLRSSAVGCEVDVTVETSPSLNPDYNAEHVQQGTLAVRIGPVYRWVRGVENAKIVKQAVLGGDMSAVIV